MTDEIKNDVTPFDFNKFQVEQNVEFFWYGLLITDPTMDETGRFPVDPKEYYGVNV
jgi:hypothetical protein